MARTRSQNLFVIALPEYYNAGAVRIGFVRERPESDGTNVTRHPRYARTYRTSVRARDFLVQHPEYAVSCGAIILTYDSACDIFEGEREAPRKGFTDPRYETEEVSPD